MAEAPIQYRPAGPAGQSKARRHPLDSLREGKEAEALETRV